MPSDPPTAWAQAVGEAPEGIYTPNGLLYGMVIRDPETAGKLYRAFLASLDRAGFVLAPKEATEGMVYAATVRGQAPNDGLYASVYRAAIAARPAMPPEDPPHTCPHAEPEPEFPRVWRQPSDGMICIMFNSSAVTRARTDEAARILRDRLTAALEDPANAG